MTSLKHASIQRTFHTLANYISDIFELKQTFIQLTVQPDLQFWQVRTF